MNRVPTFTLRDDRGATPEVEVSARGGFLNLTAAGYGQCVSLDWQNGRLRRLCNPDPQVEDLVILTIAPDPDTEEDA